MSLSLYERSAYPRTGALAFAEGSDALVAALESISGVLSERAALDGCLRALSKALAGECSAGLEAHLAEIPAAGGGAGASSSTPAASSSKDVDMSDEDNYNDGEEEEASDDDDDDDDNTNMDYDFERGAELENAVRDNTPATASRCVPNLPRTSTCTFRPLNTSEHRAVAAATSTPPVGAQGPAAAGRGRQGARGRGRRRRKPAVSPNQLCSQGRSFPATRSPA